MRRATAGCWPLAGFLVLFGSGVTRAQTPAPPAQAPAPSGVQTHVFLSASYVYNLNQPPSGTNALRVFDASDNAARLDVVELSFLKDVNGRSGVGFRVDLEAGWTIPKAEAASGLFRDPVTGKAQNVDVQQAYLSFVAPAGSGLRFDVGKFVSPIGLEVIEGWDGYDDNASRSLLFGLAEPFTHTGVKMSYAFTPKVSGAVMVVQGWDNVQDNNTAKSVLGQIALTPSDAVSLTVNAMTGPEQTGDNRDRRTVLDVVATWKATASTTVGLNVDAGREAHAAISGGLAVWGGVAAYLRHAFTSRLALAMRGEVFDDPDGARTGTAQRVGEFTVTPEVRFSPHALIRGDMRVDRSNRAVFDAKSGPKSQQPTVSVNVVLVR